MMTACEKVRTWLTATCLAAAIAGSVWAADWPTYRGDIQRSGISREELAGPLSLDWTFTAPFPPKHAWGDPQPKPVEGNLELPRLRFDDAFHVVAAGKILYFGSSSDNKVYALDSESGRIRWEFFTDGPVRCAPTISDGRLYVGSDDGKVYCLGAADGELSWVFSAAPGPLQVLGNGKMCSLWPVRTGVIVDAGVAYFGAGVFPSEGLYMYAVDAVSGKLIWKNDTYGRGGNTQITPQGYLLASGDRLFQPSGRNMPIAFDRKTGRLVLQINQSWRSIKPCGGTYTVLAGDLLYNGTEQIVAVNQSSGKLAFNEEARRIILAPDTSYLLTGKRIIAYDRAKWEAVNRKRIGTKRRLNALAPEFQRLKHQTARFVRKEQDVPEDLARKLADMEEKVAKERGQDDVFVTQLEATERWNKPCDFVDSLALSKTVLFAGGDGMVRGHDAATGAKLWESAVSGHARGLAVADGRLFVATDTGAIHCFVPGEATGRGLTTSLQTGNTGMDTAADGALAKQIIADTKITAGYALVVGADETGVATELAKQSGLMVYVIDPDQRRVAEARKVVNHTGLYGDRVIVSTADLRQIPYADYFADLIVCRKAVDSVGAAELQRVLKPRGGVALVAKESGDAFRAATAPGIAPTVVGNWLRLDRGALPGAGSWTHQYGEPGNTACGDDQLVRGPLGVLWFGEPGPGRMPSRHASAAAPLAIGGRMFVQGENVIMAYDTYNGRLLWERDISGAMRVGLKHRASNLVANEDSLFAVIKGECVRLDAATGETKGTYLPPPDADGKPRRWGEFIACVDGTLFGSIGSHTVFAVDIATGNGLWTSTGKSLINRTLCISEGRLFFIDYGTTDAEKEQVLATIDAKQRLDRHGKDIPPDIRRVVALDTRTGETLWTSTQYVSDCVKIGAAGGDITVMASKGVVVLCGQPWNGHFWPEFMSGEFSRRSLIALDAATGKPLWSGKKGYRSRPLIVGDMILAEPWAHDLKTGKEIQRAEPLTGTESQWQMSRTGHHCGNIAAAPNMLLFRSGAFAYYDLTADYGTVHFGAQRTGCWINFIPACGVLLMPEASSGCVCPYSLQCTVAMNRRNSVSGWGTYSSTSSPTPIKDIAFNFGAPGDRKASDGRLWLAFPRPASNRLAYTIKLAVQHSPGGGYFKDNSTFLQVGNTDSPWIYGSGSRGMKRCAIPLVGDADGAALYTVRCTFAAPDGDQPGKRVFDIKLQGTVVAENVDIVREAGGANKAVTREFEGIKVSGQLIVEMLPKAAKPSSAELPLLNGIEIVREKVLHVGMAVPPFELNDLTPKAKKTVRLANHTTETFEGKLVLKAPPSFTVSPATVPVALAPGESTQIPLELSVAAKGEASESALTCTLLDAAGRTEFERSSTLTYLGPRGRLVIHPDADAHVRAASPTSNAGKYPTLAVDGGNAVVGDEHHSIAYLRFPLAIPGKPVSVLLRIFVPDVGHSQSGNSGVIKLVEGPWEEAKINMKNAPERGAEIGKMGKVGQGIWIERKLDVDLTGRKSLSIALDPTGCDGATYVSREGNEKPELVVEYEAAP